MNKKPIITTILIFIAGLIIGALIMALCNISYAKAIENREISFVRDDIKLPFTLNLQDIDCDAKANIVTNNNEIKFNEGKLHDFVNTHFICENTDNVYNLISQKLDNETIDLSKIISKEDIEKINYNYKFSTLNISLLQKDKTGLDDIIVPATALMCLEDGIYKIDEEKIDELVKSIDNIYRERTFSNRNGEAITIPYCKDSHFGWKVDTKNLNLQLYDALLSFNNTIEIPFTKEGNKFTNVNNVNNDIGSTYIEISIDDQHLWVFSDNNCIFDCDVVTGKDKTPTPRGTFNITEIKTNETMRGSYGTAFAEYWLRLTNSGIGIHAANWRGSFGGEIYRSNGSHGCINVSVANSRWLYENVDKGTPVVIY